MPISRFKKFIFSLVIAAFLITPVLVVVTTPTAQAQWVVTDPTNLGQKIVEYLKNMWANLKKTLGAVAYKNALSALLSKFAYDAATWIASGGTGQETLQHTDSFGDYMKDAFDGAAGEYISSLADEAGFDLFDVCNPGSDLLKINIALGIQTTTLQPDTPDCKLSEMGSNWKDAVKIDELGDVFEVSFDPAENSIGQFLTISSSIGEWSAEEAEGAKEQRKEDGPIAAKAGAVSKYVQTPGSMIYDNMQQTKEDANAPYKQYTGEVLADALNIFTSTLFSKLVERMQAGFIKESGSTLTSIVSGESVGSVEGVAAAKASFATLNQPTFNPGGEVDATYDLLQDGFIDSTLQLAITNHWRVQEYIDYLNENSTDGASGFRFGLTSDEITSPSGGMTRQAIYHLKKYRIVPVGWQIAADLIYANRENASFTEVSLGDLADCDSGSCLFEKCEDGDYSEFCKLIDPDWVFKEPSIYCEKEGYGVTGLYNEFFDEDGNEYNQLTQVINREEICVDQTTCINEDADGNCYDYGYCMRDERIYRFDGESCDEHEASCQLWTNTATGEDFAYLTNTLTTGDCNNDNAIGCEWYCTEYNDETEEWACAGADEYYTECTVDYGVPTDEYCYCQFEETCEVENYGSSCDYLDDAGATQTCYLEDTCSPQNEFYTTNCTTDADADGSIDGSCCECTIEDSARVDMTDTTGTTSLYSVTCALDDNDADGSADTCTNTYADYTTEYYCESNTCGSDTATYEEDYDCQIGDGSYTCTGSQGDLCAIGVNTTDPTSGDLYAAYLNSETETCEAADAGCTEFYEVQETGTNLIYNSSFEIYQTGNNLLGVCADDEEFCDDASDCGGSGDYCMGWNKTYSSMGVTIQENEDADPETTSGSTYIALDGTGGTDYLFNILDYGDYSLANRSFMVTMSTHSSTACDMTVMLSDYSETETQTWTVSLDADATWTTQDSDILTFSDSLTSTGVLKLSISNSCAVNIDAVHLEETGTTPSYADFGSLNNIYLNGEREECAADEVGCSLFTPTSGYIVEPIPAVVTNPNSDACQDDALGSIYTNSGCSQCTADMVGCNYYQEQPIDSTIPLGSDTPSGLLNTLGADPGTVLRDTGVNQRTGFYCDSDQSKSCYDDQDCTGVAADAGKYIYCQDTISIVPATGTTCSAAEVGCEEYTNMDTVGQGGEGIEYWAALKQCVKADDTEVDTFYTWEGSDDAGYQLHSHLLKKASIGTEDGAPCTNLDLEVEDFNAACTDGGVTSGNNCGPSAIGGNGDYGTDPDCLLYYDSDGDDWYRYESETIAVTDECIPLRNTNDARIYYALPSASTSCGESVEGCKEYKGSGDANVQVLVNDDFADCTSGNWAGASEVDVPSESIYVDNCSIALDSALYYSLYTTDDEGTNTTYLEEGLSYEVAFWAKGDDNMRVALDSDGDGVGDYYFTDEGYSTTPASGNVSLDEDEWNEYVLGPLYLESAEDDLAYLVVEFDGTTGYLDEIILQESESQYLIEGTADLCQYHEGCQEYTDQEETIHYLKSFDHLCDEDMVGCEVVLNTYNTAYDAEFESEYPFTQHYNWTNEYDEDDQIITFDQVETLVLNGENECPEEEKGCQTLGLADVNEQDGTINEWSTVYMKNDPDAYDDILCEYQHLRCEEYQSDYDGIAYFKDPGDKTCYYDATEETWYKTDVEESGELATCPLFNESNPPSQPMGPVCDDQDDDYVGQYCSEDEDCGDGRCVDTGDATGWAGTCSADTSGCTIYSDPFTGANEITNESFEYDYEDNLTETPYDEDTPEDDYDGIPDDWYKLKSFDETATQEEILDNLGVLYTSVPSCAADGFIQDTTYNYHYSNSAKISARSSQPCIVILDDRIEVDENKDYTLSSYVLTDDYASTEVSLGLIYYDSSNELLGASAAEGVGAVDAAYEITDVVDATISEAISESFYFVGYNETLGLGYFNTLTQSNPGDYYDPGVTYASATPLSLYVKIDSSHYSSSWDGLAGETVTLESDHASYPNLTITLPEIAADEVDTSNSAIYFYVAEDGTLYYADAGHDGIASSFASAWSDPEMMTAEEAMVAEHAVDPAALSSRSVTTTNYVAGENVTMDQDGGWNHIAGLIGYGESVEFPEGTTRVRPFIYVGAGGTAYFDMLTFKEQQDYYYLDYTLDGTEEGAVSGSTSDECVDGVSIGDGCVAFRDNSRSDMDVFSDETFPPADQDGEPVTETCSYSPFEDECFGQLNMSDTDTVVKVRPDRICDQWVACHDLRRVVSDTDGIPDEIFCADLQTCEELNEETTECTEWVREETYPNESDDLTYLSDPADVDAIDALDEFKDMSGFVKVGMIWPSISSCSDGYFEGDFCESNDDCLDQGDCDDGVCSGGSLNGTSCILPSECHNEEGDGTCGDYLTVQGYYPYSQMVEQGDPDDELINNNDFEELYCGGDSKVDEDSKCIIDEHCYNTEIESYNESDACTEDPWDCYELGYPDYYCPSTYTGAAHDPWPFDNWTSYSAETVEVVQYSDDESYMEDYSRFNEGDNEDQDTGTFGTDWNNVLRVVPTADSATGVEAELNSGVESDADYTLSFKAKYQDAPDADDVMSIGLVHTEANTGDTHVDYFVNGDGMADIVVVFDTSVTMEEEITNAIATITSLVTELEANGVDYKLALVDMEELSDDTFYTVITQNFTSDIDEFSDALVEDGGTTANDGLDAQGAAICMYDAIADAYLNEVDYIQVLAGGDVSLTDFDGSETIEMNSGDGKLNFRSKAGRFVITLTDTVNDEQATNAGQCTHTSESSLFDEIQGLGPLYMITETELCDDSEATCDTAGFADTTAGCDYYDVVTDMEGSCYDIEAASYDEILTEISTDIVANADAYSFDTIWKTYTLGPITITEKPERTSETGTITTTLVIRQGATSSGQSFIIDDVSLLPTLEVNAELDTVARSCRAYPEEDSLACVYEAEGGNNYRGWMGYCLESDPEDRYNCLVWWPTDTIAGESSISTLKEESGYRERSPVYHCLVAKGWANSGVCADVAPEGTMPMGTGEDNFNKTLPLCSSDSDCDDDGEHDKVCFRGIMQEDDFTFIADNEVEVDYDFAIDGYHYFDDDGDNDLADQSDGYRIITRKFMGAPVVKKYNFDSDSTWDVEHNTSHDPEDKFAAVRMMANPIERNVHISELNRIEFDPGHPGDYGGDAEQYAYSPEARSGDYLEISITDNSADWEFAEDADLETFCRIWEDKDPDGDGGGNERGIGCYWVRQYEDTDGSKDFIYTYGFSQHNERQDEDTFDSCSRYEVLNEDCFNADSEEATISAQVKRILSSGGLSGQDEDYNNPWNHLNEVGLGSSYAYRDGGSEELEGIFDDYRSPDNGENTDTDFIITGESNDQNAWFTASLNNGSDGGGNVVSVLFDFDDQGYLYQIFTLTFNGAKNTSNESIVPAIDDYMDVRYFLREPCVVMAEGVSEDGDNYAWVDRISEGSTYTLPGPRSTYEMFDDVDDYPMGAASPYEDLSVVPKYWDIISPSDANYRSMIDPLTEEDHAPYIGSLDGALNAGWPLTCIGDCSTRACANNQDQPCVTSTDCDAADGPDTNCYGVGGTCSDGTICGQDSDCDTGSCAITYISGRGANNGSTFRGQIVNVAADADERYKHLFANPYDPTYYVHYKGDWDTYYDDFAYLSTTIDFDDMPKCSGICGTNERCAVETADDWNRDEDDEDEYCGVLPEVTNLTVNGNSNGEVVLLESEKASLSFTSSVDEQQTPLNTVRVDWGRGDSWIDDNWEAAPTTHYYETWFSCDGSIDEEYYCEDAETFYAYDPDSDLQGTPDIDCADYPGKCVFRPKVQLQDNWNWCSGGTGGHDRDTDSQDCNSYDIFDGVITVVD